MRTGLRSRIGLLDSLGVRLAALLSLALLPIGVIAIAQGVRTLNEAQRVSDTALGGRTAEAAAAERGLMLTAFGAAEALSDSIIALQGDPIRCRALLANFVHQSGAVVFAGYASVDGAMRCYSEGQEIDLSSNPSFIRMMEQRSPWVSSQSMGRLSQEPVVIIRWPVFGGEEYLGYLILSLPQRAIDDIRSFGDRTNAPEIITFNQDGEILTSDDPQSQEVQSRLPSERNLVDLVRDSEQTFAGTSIRGEKRIFTVVPVISGQVYALGSWPVREVPLSAASLAPAILLPLLMWLASVGVAYFAVHRLVIRPIRVMRGQMRRFALGQRGAPPEVLVNAPAEIQDVSQTFHNLARILIRDEAELEASIKEKTVLLKEVHHRVKNNLQLIASIMNMQIRRVKEPSARRVLRSVQDRVMSLATIHRSLYTAERLSAVPVNELLAEITNQMVVLAGDPGENIEVDSAFDRFTLYPDQAVPLALLATEAVTNAMKYIGRPADGRAWMRLRLTHNGDGTATFTVVNTCGAPIRAGEVEPNESTGLGEQLMRAFVDQIGGGLIAGIEGETYRVEVTFPIDQLVRPG